MSAAGDDDRPSREIAYRLFATEFDDADFSYSESDEERAPNYVVTPTGARVNRLFVVGVLTEVERVNDDTLRGRVVDPTGAFVTYAGQYQPDAMAFLDRASPPTFAALTGKARTFQPEDSDRVFTSVRPESLSRVDASTRDRWTVATAEATLRRVGVMAAALDAELRGDDLRAALEERGVASGLAAGVPLALDHYGTTPGYLDALREVAVEALEVVADERDAVRSLDVAPDDPGGDVDLAALAALYDWDGDEPGLAGDSGVASPPPESTGSEPLAADATGANTAESGATGDATSSDAAGKASTSASPSASPSSEPESSSSEPESSSSEPESTTSASESASSDTASSEASSTPTSAGDTPDASAESTGETATSNDTAEASTEPTEATETAETPGTETGGDGAEAADDGSDAPDADGLEDFEGVEESAGDSDALGDFEDTDETADSDALGDFEDTDGTEAGESSSASIADADADVGMYELDDEERAEIESEYGAEFETGSEVDPAGEADIDVPSADELDELAESADEEAAASETEAVEEPSDSLPPSGDDVETAETAETAEPEAVADAADVDLEDAAVAAMADLDDGDGASREAVVAHVVEEYGVDPGDVADAIQSALMSGQCYEPTEDSLKAI